MKGAFVPIDLDTPAVTQETSAKRVNAAKQEDPAKHEATVKQLYQDEKVAENYIANRFTWAWSRLLHERQIAVLNALLRNSRLSSALELAPGPARIAPDLVGLRSGLMVEASPQMIEVATRRIVEHHLEKVWEIQKGNAFDLTSLSRTFDLAFTFRFIRHFEAEERKRLYSEIHRRLNPSGLLVFDVVNKPVRRKLDARAKPHSGEALPVYDITYTRDELTAEMNAAGFEVVALYEVIRHFTLQAWLSYRVGHRLPGLAWPLVKALELLPTSNPLEWVAICRKLG